MLGATQRAWLAALAPTGERDGAELFHGSPRDPVWEYVLSEEVALDSLLETTAPLVLVGHSHVALALGWTATRWTAAWPRRGPTPTCGGTLAAQPRLGRAAARRRPARGLAAD